MTGAAAIILDQLGGSTFLAMTGARNLQTTEDSLMFRLPSGFAKHRINHVIVHLEHNDTYTLTFGTIRNFEYSSVARSMGIYSDVLRSVFTSTTGLDTSLGRRRA